MNRASQPGDIRVLHVDDDPDFADLTADFLKREGDRFSVATAESADEGLERLAAESFDCVVSDYDMPGSSGIEFLEAVRADDPELPFVLFTGKGSEEVASDAISAGVTEYLQKSPGGDQYAVLANRIENAVAHSRSRRRVARSERRLREVVDSVPHLMYVVDDGGQYRLANEALASFHGTTVAAIEGSTVDDVLGQPAAEAFERDLAAVLAADEPKRCAEIELTDADGENRVFEPVLFPYESGETDRPAVLGVATDVTGRVRRQRELERYEAYLEGSTDIITVLDDDWTVRYQSPSVERVLGHEPADLVGTDGFSIVHPDDEAALRETLSELVADPSEAVTTEARFRTADEEYRWLEVHGRSYLDHPRIDGVVVNGRDITRRKRREARLETLSRTTRDLVAADTRAAVAATAVEAATDALGMTASAVHLYDEAADGLVPVAQNGASRDLIGEAPTLDRGQSIAWRVYETGEPAAVDDVREDPDLFNPNSPVRSELILPIGDERVLIAGSPTPAAVDDADRLVGEILATNIATILDQVAQTERLRTRERELLRQNDRLEEFASVVSHDLRNPLQVATGRLELLESERDDGQLAAIEEALARMDALIDDLLTLARAGERVRDLEPVDLAALVRDGWAAVETPAATLTVETTLTVRADRSRLKQLLENLFRNAVEHAGDDATVTVGDVDDGRGFFVADDGPGVPTDDRSRLFEAGYSTTEGGTGFGLNIVEEVGDAHGWDVTITDADSGGARFEVTGCDRA